MAKIADLHIHTHFSDSTSSPEEVVDQAFRLGIHCISITDHDILEGIAPTIRAAAAYDIEVIPGIELSTQANNKDVHILGYLIDYENPGLIEELKLMQHSRLARMKLMISKLSELGVGEISFEEVCALTESDAVGRPHLATIMVKQGIVPNMRAAFDKYLADDKPAFVPKLKLSASEGIRLILKYGGVPVLAHPMFTMVDELIPGLVDDGLKGIEVYYPNCMSATTEFYLNLSKKYNLIATGGSDAHGSAKRNTYLGKLTIPYELVEQLKAAHRG
ncbi:MAG: PHP domain-containing protein [Candidatus Omnitrophica bacterium]|nr:PHP domain-containing protein [Candidatus Omnitrophota bacterium]